MFSTSHVPRDINVILNHSFIVVITFCNSQLLCLYRMTLYIIVLRVIPGILIMLFIALNVLLGDTE